MIIQKYTDGKLNLFWWFIMLPMLLFIDWAIQSSRFYYVIELYVMGLPFSDGLGRDRPDNP